jgi:hypothetical protein
MGEYNKSKFFYKKSLEIFENILGKTHPYTSTVRENLEILLQKYKI